MEGRVYCPEKTAKNLAKGRKAEYKAARIVSDILSRKYDFGDTSGLEIEVTKRNNKEDLEAFLINYAENSKVLGRICRIEVEESWRWVAKVDDDFYAGWPYQNWSLLDRKINNVEDYSDIDVYLVVSKGVSKDVCFWWIFGSLRRAIKTKEYYEQKESSDYREWYWRKNRGNKRGVHRGWESLVEYLVALYIKRVT